MSVTASQVIARLEAAFSDTTSAKWTAAQKLAAVNMAIDDAWPAIKYTLIDSTITLAATTFEYQPVAVPERELGFMQAYVTTSANPKVLLRRVRQRRGQSAASAVISSTDVPYILIPPDIASAFAGQTLHLLYHLRLDNVADTTGEIDAPLDYLWKSAAYFLCIMQLTKAAHFEVRVYDGLAAAYKRDAAEAKLRAWRNRLTPMIAWVNDGGAGGVDRYGQNIVSNP